VKTMLDAMSSTLSQGDRIEIRGFGSFGLNFRPPRTGRNPKTGEKVLVPKKYVPHFKAGKELRERVDEALEAAEAAAAAAREQASAESSPASSPSIAAVRTGTAND
jgi:integration host factor subunit beta